MEHIDEIAEMMVEEGGGGGPYTAKSVALDFATNYGFPDRSGFRCIEFFFEGSLLSSVAGIAGETSVLNANYLAYDCFYVRLKTGSNDRGWLSDSIGDPVAGQRIFATFATPITFDKIVVNNYHGSGTIPEAGIKDTKIYTTEDTGAISTVYDSAITGRVLIYDGIIREHIAVDSADDEILNLI